MIKIEHTLFRCRLLFWRMLAANAYPGDADSVITLAMVARIDGDGFQSSRDKDFDALNPRTRMPRSPPNPVIGFVLALRSSRGIFVFGSMLNV